MKSLLAFFIMLPAILFSQRFNPEKINTEIDGMDDESKVDFINNHFYELYSADFDNAIDYTQQAIEISESNQWESKMAYALMYNGIVNYLRGNYEKAISSFISSEIIFLRLEDLNGLARLNNEMANFFQKQQDFKKSQYHLDQAESYAKKANDQVQLGTNYGMRGTFLVRQDKIEEAQPYFEKVYTIRKSQNDSVGLGYVYLNFADYEVFKGSLSKAIDYIDSSNRIREKINDFQGLAEGMHTMGNAYAEFGEFTQAKIAFNASNDLSAKFGYLDQIRLNYEALEKIALRRNNFEEAHSYLQKSQQFSDSLFSLDKTKLI